MNDIRIVSEKLEKLLTDRSVSVYEYTVSESETRELNTEKTDFNLFRTIFGGCHPGRPQGYGLRQ